MKPKFSEFQFAYGVTRELEGGGGWGLIGTPRIPTQNQEAELPVDMVAQIEDGDVPIAPLFVQYKRSEWMKRRNAGEWDELDKRGLDLSDGYYRFRPYLGENEQHNKLVDLADRQPLTFYVAPMFHEMDEYLSYAGGSLLRNTAFIQCGNLDEIRADDHRITYTPQDTAGYMFSEPTRFPVRSVVEAFDSDILGQNASTFRTLRREFADIRELVAPPDHRELSDYNAADPAEWFARQQEYLTAALDTDVLFFADMNAV